MSIKKLVLGVVLTAVVSLLIAGTIVLNMGVSSIVRLPFNYDPAKLDQTEAVPLASINELKIKSVAEDIKLIPVDTQEIKAHMYGDVSNKSTAPKLVTELSGSSLTIKVDYGVITGINRGQVNLSLDVEVPRSFKGDLYTKTVSSQVTAENLILNKFNAHSVAGDIRLGGLNSRQCAIETVSGDATLRDLTSNLTFNSISGDLDTEFRTFTSDAGIKTTSGNVRLSLPANPNFTLRYKSVSGTLTNDFASNQRDGNYLNLVQTIGKGGNNIVIQSISGDTNILSR